MFQLCCSSVWRHWSMDSMPVRSYGRRIKANERQESTGFLFILQFCARQEHRHCNTAKSRALRKKSHHFRREQREPAQTWGHAGGLEHAFARFPLAHCQQHTPSSSCTQPAQEANTEPPRVQLWKDMPGCALKRHFRTSP